MHFFVERATRFELATLTWQFASSVHQSPHKTTNVQVRGYFSSRSLPLSRAVSQPFAGFLRDNYEA